ncbi:MAG: hypothetical protein FWC49_01010 [Proteobacteria bacterium]|nr:hypothetical protein [Pseudomonadota bacterium]
MKKAYWALIVAAGLSLSGCAAKEAQRPKEEPVVRTTEADAILACAAENRKFSRQEFDRAYKAALAKATQPDSAELSPLICLSLHPQATYKQFKAATEVLVRSVRKHPESAPSLRGLVQLLQRLDQEKIGKRAQNSKHTDEREELESENKELLDRIETLEKNAVQDQDRIKGLQQQIEQLKNIENIIKNRER